MKGFAMLKIGEVGWIEEAQGGYSMHSGGMLAGWKFSNFKDGLDSEFFHVNDADGNLAHMPAHI